MPRTNPDPHENGYVYQPTNTVTAFLPAGQDLQPLLRALSDAGCASESIDVYVGAQGTAQLDLRGKQHGSWVGFRRGLETVFADEVAVYERAEHVLLSGGSIVTVFTDGDIGQKERAVGILKTHHGNEVMYWGELAIERF